MKIQGIMLSCAIGILLSPLFYFIVVRCPRTGKAITNGRIVGNGTRTGGGLRYDTIRYFCDEGYWYTGTATRSCQRNEMWSGESGTCDGNDFFIMPLSRKL